MMTVVIWNMQGGGFATGTNKSTILNNFFTKGGGYHDVICIQEATEPLPSFNKTVGEQDGICVFKTTPPQPGQRCSPRFPTDDNTPGIHNYTCYYYKWGDKNARCSLATYVKNGLYNFGVDCGIIQPTFGDTVRPTLWIKVPTADITVANIHLPSGNPVLALKTFQNIREEVKKLSPRRYAVLGDFNIHVTDLEKHQDAKYFQAIVGSTQQSGNTLDYVYYENGPVSFAGPDKTTSSRVPSDHQYLIITFP